MTVKLKKQLNGKRLLRLQQKTGMRLFNRADGVNGHFCIGRKINESKNFYEFYNKGKWLSAGELFTSFEEAFDKLKELSK